MWASPLDPSFHLSSPERGHPMWLELRDPLSDSRRRFLRRGVAAGVTAATASLWWNVLQSAAENSQAAAALPPVTDFLGQDQVAELLRLALAGGGDFAEVYGEYTVSTSFVVDEQKLKTAQYGVLSGVGIRVIAGEQVGYAYADEYGMEALREAARAAGTIARSGKAATPRPFAVSPAKPPFVLQRPLPLSLGEEQRIALARRADQAARATDKRIAQVNCVMADTARSMLVANSDGLWATDRQFVARLACQPTAIDGTNRQSSNSIGGGAVEAEYFEKVLSPEAIGREAAESAIALLSAEEPKAGTYPVILAPGWGGVLAHECFGHSLEGDGIRRKTSIRAFQFGQKVCADIVNLYDDGTVPFSRGSFTVDDEGTPSRKNHVVENGVLRGYLWDVLNARITGNQPTGNGRRNSYRDFPIPRMTNTYIGGGTDSPDSLLSSVQSGLYAKRLGGGSVNPADGNFSFVVLEAYKIENGKLGACVKGATLTGNAAEAMLKVVGLGNDLAIDGARGTCGKDGQWKPVGVGQPTVKFSEMTVGGTQV
jgi:TldD protein